MAGQQLKSQSVTNLDGDTYGIITANTAGKGAGARAEIIEDYVAVTLVGLTSTASTYKMVRLPTDVMLKKIEGYATVALDTSTGLKLDVGAYYSDSTKDGTPKASQGTAISATAFASASTIMQSSGGVASPVNLTPTNTWDPVKQQQPLWQALGLSSNPGGYIDIVVAVNTAATSGAASTFGVRATYVKE